MFHGHLFRFEVSARIVSFFIPSIVSLNLCVKVMCYFCVQFINLLTKENISIHHHIKENAKYHGPNFQFVANMF